VFVNYNGVDRLDNNTGYLLSNCQTLCYTCNQAKHTMPMKVFKEWIEQIIKAKNQNKGIWCKRDEQ